MNSVNYFNPNPLKYAGKDSYVSKTYSGLLFQAQKSQNKLGDLYLFIFRYTRKQGPWLCVSWYQNRARNYLRDKLSETALSRVMDEIQRHYESGALQWHESHERPNADEVARLKASIAELEAKYRAARGLASI